MKEINGKLYSKTQFANYEYRLMVIFFTEEFDRCITIYTNETDFAKIFEGLVKMVSKKVMGMKMYHYATKAQDDGAAAFIDEVDKMVKEKNL